MKATETIPLVFLLAGLSNAVAAVHYVDANGTNATSPYTNWVTAATNIQDAVDAAVTGDEIVVSNGTYATGKDGYNRVVVDKALAMRSVNGPEFTIIDGGQSNRCVYLTDGASLAGFTLTNGYNYEGGGASCESTNASLLNCVLSGNYACVGGGAYRGTLNNCTLASNSASDGGNGGGAAYCALNNCRLTGNSTAWGGGAYDGTLNNCVLSGNSAHWGGGAYGCTLNNCTLTDNSAVAWWSYGETGSHFAGGGAYGCTLNNCIACFNTAPQGAKEANYDSSSTLNYCCTSPQATNGIGNISLDPQLASASHLSASSPCRGAGSAAYATGTDIDGEPWASPPSIGCDEYHVGAVTGQLSMAIEASFTNVAIGFSVKLTALIEGRIVASTWDFGDGITATNQPYASHFWRAPGHYAVVLHACNEDFPAGISATVAVHVVSQPVHYVAADSAHPVAPYTNWVTAAANIQDAVDAASVPGAVVLVTNGIYACGNRAGVGYTQDRVAVGKPLVLRSVNGPQFTVIDGGQSNRCMYLTDGANLSGFTLSNGYAGLEGGGVCCDTASAMVSNCVISGNHAGCWYDLGGYGGGAYGGTLNNCTLSGNSAWADGGSAHGGGADSCTLNNCTLTANSAGFGGGAASSTLNNCTLTANSAFAIWASLGGWVVGSGGACSCTLNNCIVYYNSAAEEPNYDSYSTLNYCCTTPLPTNGVGNISLDPQLASASHLSASSPCRGAGSAVYATGTDIDGEPWGSPPSMGSDEVHPESAVGPLVVSTEANPTNMLLGTEVSFTALIQGIPIASRWEFDDGTVVSNRPYVTRAWTVAGDYAVTLRAYNLTWSDGVSATAIVHVATGPLAVGISASYTNVATGFDAAFAAQINGYPSAFRWEFDDGMTVSNVLSVTHAWLTAGDYAVVLRAYNGTYPAGVGATQMVHVVENPVHYVALDSPAPAYPYDSWGTAATNIQDAVDAAAIPGAVVLVTNGIYAVGERQASRVVVDKPLTVRSVNGPQLTAIDGGQSNRCVRLASGASLSGFTLTNGYSDYPHSTYPDGGGVSCQSTTAVVFNCVISGNRAGGNSAGNGGGASGGTLNNCTLRGNHAGGISCGTWFCVWGVGGGAYGSVLNNCTLSSNGAYDGGGAWGCSLNNCTLTGNSATGWGSDDSGGASNSRLNNCIVYYNTAAEEPNYDSYSTLNYCCTTPQTTNGFGNITNAPLFVEQASGNFRLQPNSPCINAGRNALAPSGPDPDGNPRIAGGTVDIGAYEFQSPTSIISYAWLQHYGLPTDGSADFTDPDGDGLNNWQEWRCGTDPTNALSALRLLSPSLAGSNVTVTWQSVAGVNYFLERAIDLAASPTFTPLATNLPGQPGTTTYLDTNTVDPGPFFYRVGVTAP